MAATPSTSAELWLTDWHDRHPGATARAFARGRPSSYERLASSVRPGESVLDLACGDGYLLDLLRGKGAGQLAGLDLSAGELAAARERLGGAATLRQGRAQAMPFPDGSFELVTCHMALMLMRPVEEVVSEVRRVLRPGGRFAAIVGFARSIDPDNAWSRITAHLAGKELRGPALGDPRTRDAEGLRDLFSACSEVRVEPLEVDLSGTPDEIWALFTEVYPFEMMSAEAAKSMERSVRADFVALLRADGTLPCSFSLAEITATR